MSDIGNTKLKFWGPLPKFHVRRAEYVFGYRAEFEQNNAVRAEF